MIRVSLSVRMRRALVLVLSAVLATAGMLAAPVPAQAGTFATQINSVYLNPTGHPTLCVTAASASSGALLTLQTCGSNPSLQRWTITTDDRILFSANTSLCLDNNSNGSNNNVQLNLTTGCASGAANATWPYQLQANGTTGAPQGSFYNARGAICIDNTNGRFAVGNPVSRYQCSTTNTSQMFSIGYSDMEVTGSTNPTGRPGATVTAQLHTLNRGPQTGYFNRIAITADTGLTIGSVTRYYGSSGGYGNCTTTSATAANCAAGAGGWASGNDGLLYVPVTIPANAVPGTVYNVCGTNSITPTNDNVPGNNRGCATVTVAYYDSDLAMTNTGNGNQTATTAVDPGASVQVPFTLTNRGPDTAGTPSVTFTAPSGFTVTGLTGPASGWTCTASTLTCAGPVNSLANNGTAAFTVTGTIANDLTAGGAIGDVTATSAVGGYSRDGNAANDTATNTLRVNSNVTIDVAKTGRATADPGDPVEYTVTVTNNGRSRLTGATLTDTVPGGVTVTSWTCTATAGSCGTASGSGNDVSTTLDLPAGASATVTITGTVARSASGTTVTNTATIAMPSGLTNGGTASASAATTVRALTDITVASDPVTIAPGASGTVTATVRNAGPADAAENTTATVTFPTGVTITDLDSRCTDNGNGTATCTIPAATLRNGASTGITFTATVPADAATGTQYTGKAEVSYKLDSDTTNNTADLVVNTGAADSDFGITASGPQTVVPGENGTVTFTVANHGPSVSVSAATVTLTAPDQAVFSGTLPDGCVLESGNRRVTCTVAAGTAVNSATDFALQYTVDPGAAAGTITGTGRVANADDHNAANDTADWTATVAAASADLAITKEGPADTVRPGETFDYTLTITNNGPSTAVNAAVTDVLADQLAFVSADGCTASGQTVTCAIASFPPGTRTLTITVRLDAAYTGTGADLPNSATIGADTPDPDESNNRSGTVTPGVGDPAADLAITKRTSDDTPVAPGETFTYTLHTANLGPSAATGARITDTLPSALAFASSDTGCTGTAGEYGGTVACDLGTIAAGAGTDSHVTVRLDPSYTGTGTDAAATNTATVAADTADPDDANNTDTAALPGGTVAAPSADVVLSKERETTGPVAPGQNVTYEIIVSNRGPSTATGIAVTDTLPDGMAFASSSSGCTASGRTVTCPTVATLLPGRATGFHVTATVDAGYTGDGTDLVNAATADPETADPDESNNSDSVALAPGGVTAPSADLSIAKSSSSDTAVAPGQTFTYTLTVTNHGPSDAVNASVADSLPSAIAFVSADDCTGTAGEYGATVTCGPAATVRAASGSNTVAYAITVRLDPAYTGDGSDIVNNASVTADTADPNTANNRTSLAGVPGLSDSEADLSIEKTVVGSPSIAPGGTFEYDVTITNLGPSTALNPSVTETLGEGLTWTAYPQGCSVDGRTLTCPAAALDAQTLPDEGQATIRVGVKLDSGYTRDGSELTNTAVVASDTPDPVSDNDTATATGGVAVTGPSADLRVAKTIVSPATATPGGYISYRITVANDGPSDAADVVVTDDLPAGLAFAGAVDDECTASGQAVTCGPVAVLTAGSTAEYRFRVQLDASYTGDGSDLGNAATASSGTDDPDESNNTSDTVYPVVGAASADLSIAKRLDATGPVTPGTAFDYTLTIANAGPSTARNAAVTDTLDDSLAFVSASPDVCTASGQDLTCGPVDPFAVGSTTIELTVRLAAGYTGDGSEITNTAVVASDTADPDDSNNTATSGALAAGPASADVSLRKAAVGDGPLAPGESFEYTLTIANAGPSTAVDTAVTDTLPVGTAFVSSDDCTASGRDLTCTAIASLAVGAQTVYRVTVRIDPSYTGDGSDLVNTATATAATPDPDRSNNTGTAPVPGGNTGEPRAAVSITKTAVSPVTAGGTGEFTITVANTGPSTATGVTVTDTLPDGLAYAGADGASCTATGHTIACDLDTLDVDETREFTVSVDVDAAVPDGTVLTNTAAVTTASRNTSADTTATADVTVRAEANVSIVKAQPAAMTAGAEAVYTITVANGGPSAAVNVRVTDQLDPSLSFVSADGADCADDDNLVTCTLGTVPAGATRTFTVTVLIAADTPAGTRIANYAEVATDTGNTSDRTRSGGDGPLTGTAADLAITKTANSTEHVVPGETFEYTLAVENRGPSDAQDPVVTDTLPAELSFVSGDGCTAADRTVTCPIGTVLAAGADASFTVTVELDEAYTGDGTAITNTAAVASDTDDPDESNNTATAGLPGGRAAAPSADLSITKRLNATGPVTPGDRFTYTVTVANAGPSAATQAVVTDTLPPALTWDGTDPECAIDGRDAACDAGAIAVGASVEYTFTVRLDPAYTGDGSDLVNTARVKAATADPDESNNTATADAATPGTPSADLALAKAFDGTGTVAPGQTVPMVLTVTNNGPSTATGIAVTDTLPAELAFTSSQDGCTGEPGAYGGTVECATPEPLDPAEARTFRVTVQLDPSYTGDGADIANTATVSADTDDPDLTNNTAVADLTGRVGGPVADVLIAKTAPREMTAGHEATWTVTVTNNGPSTATGVTVADRLHDATSFVSASPDLCTASGQDVSCDLGSIESGRAVAVELTVMVDPDTRAGTAIENTAAVRADTDPPTRPARRATAVAPGVQVVADLAVAKDFADADAGPVTPGTDFDYRITATNLSGSTVDGELRFADRLPGGLAFTSARHAATGDAVDCTASGRDVECALAARLRPGDATAFLMTVTLDPSYRGDGALTNTVVLSSTAVDDPDLSNNTASVTGVPGGVGAPEYDRHLTAEDAPAVLPGAESAMSYRIVNYGPSTADGEIRAVVTMPEHVTALATGQPRGCTAAADGRTVTCVHTGGIAVRGTEAAPAGALTESLRTEALPVAEAAPARELTGEIRVRVDADAPAETVFEGGSVAVNADGSDPDDRNDTVSWQAGSLKPGGSGSGSGTGTVPVTGGDTLSLLLTGAGAVLAGLALAAAAGRRRNA
ncbi:isopeptide-forming domain-containing fimbrial protein [Glycomyces sp. NPDC047010]|uniref:isopeptide-forming domain-containing fimbrial protein n=1 Tax=Glycomyces sp. NPDC047010 TaxID=3155023 RepID=UPI0033EC5B7D